MSVIVRTCCLLMVLALFAAQAAAQGQDAKEGERVGVHVGFGASGIAAADVDGGDGSASVASAGLSVGCRVSDLSYTVSDWRWDDVSRLPFGNRSDDPWGTLHELSLDLHHEAGIDEHWAYFVGGGASAAWEDEMGDSGAASLRGGAVYAFDSGVSLSFGAIALLHKTGLTVLPVLGLDYGSASDLGFSYTLGAPETWLRWRFDPAWLVRLGASLDGGTYRLADDSVVARKGYVSSFGVAAGAMADFTPMDGLTVSFGPELYFARSLTVYDKDGDKIERYSVAPAPGASASVRYAF